MHRSLLLRLNLIDIDGERKAKGDKKKKLYTFFCKFFGQHSLELGGLSVITLVFPAVIVMCLQAICDRFLLFLGF